MITITIIIASEITMLTAYYDPWGTWAATYFDVGAVAAWGPTALVAHWGRSWCPGAEHRGAAASSTEAPDPASDDSCAAVTLLPGLLGSI